MSVQDHESASARKLSTQHRNYIAKETVISAVINSLLSFIFALLASHGVDRMTLLGGGGMAVDFLPQCFMITLATTLAVTLLTRKRLRAGEVRPLTFWMQGPRNPLIRAVVFGLVVAVIAGPSSALLLYGLDVQSLPATSFIVMKVLYGCGLALLISPLIIRAALAQATA